ncbi:uncharacterized protein [Sinocyclocheilus grahami]|uniref:uncharacterized protein isoform X1 n=1 Tax=Sinocyclocheilus grahami TaxID=75366 RepID=UPI0007AC9E67|nr:PREDICTED: uncharacterized protein LOC107575326 isoform X1 [Sinocyclocheilus grahami]
MMTASRVRRKMPPGLVNIRECDKENLKSCGLQLISHVMKEFKKEQNKLRAHVNEILHSIFFLGTIHKDSLTPEDIIPEKIAEIRQEFPEPFKKYKSHLPKRTPFSILLDIMQLTYDTKDKVLKELCILMDKLKFPYPLDRPANKNQRYYTLESTVICVCSNSQRTSDEYFGASLGCRTGEAKRIMIYSSCINTWHEHVSYAVMSFKHQPEGDSLQFHESLRCQAYFRDWKDNTYKKRQPCMNCKRLFSLSAGTEQEDYPYGNCAETECLSKLLFNDQFMRENIKISHFTPDKMKMLKDCTREHLRKLLASIPSLSNMNNDDLPCF